MLTSFRSITNVRRTFRLTGYLRRGSPIGVATTTATPRVLHLYSDRKWTGSAEPVVNLCRELQAEFSIALMHERRKNKPVEIARMIAERGVRSASSLFLRKHPGLIHLLIDVRRLATYIRREGIELIHVHRSADHLVGGPAGLVTSTPVLRTFHEDAATISLRDKVVLNRFTDGLIVPSNEARLNILDGLSRATPRIWVVPPAIDVNRFNPERLSREAVRRKLGLQETDFVLGVASRIRPERKVDVALEAFRIAQKQLPQLRLVIIGRGNERNLKKCLWEPIERFGMEKVVRHLGYLPGEEYVEALAAVDAGVYLNSGTDKTCRTILEFMAMGKPLIVGRRGILPTLVDHGENGVQVDADSKRVAEAIIYLADAPQLSRKMGERGLFRARTMFSLELQAAEISKIYRSFL